MSNKTLVSINNIKKALAVIERFNSLDLANVDFWLDGVPLEIPQEVIDDWKFIGLANKDFVELEWWKPENRFREMREKPPGEREV